MYFATFHTRSPLSHVQRALDELSRAGFELRGLYLASAAAGPDGAAHVRIDYGGTATVSPDTYLQRLARLSEVSNVLGGTVFGLIPAPEAAGQEA